MENLYVGVDLGGTKIFTALANKNGEILNEIVVKTEAEKGEKHIVDKIKHSIHHVMKECDKSQVKAIGLGSPGPLNIEKGLIAEPANLPFINYPIVDELYKEFNINVHLDNDANVATLAEYMFGSGKNAKNMVYVTVSTGIGGGAILNGEIYRGSTSNALEVGHITVDTSGRRCGCGNLGCVEAMSSGTAIMKAAKDAISSRVDTSLRSYDNVTSKEVFIEASKGDRVSKEIVENAMSYLGIAISNYANILDPDIIVIGGGITGAGDIVLNSINKEMSKRCLGTILRNCRVVKSDLGSKIGVLGAIALAIMESENKQLCFRR